MESIIRSLAEKHLSKLLKDFDAERDLTFRLFKGEVEIQNVNVNEAVVREALNITTLDVKRINVSNLVLKLNPLKLTAEPVEVRIDRLDLVLAECDPSPIIPQKKKKHTEHEDPDKKKQKKEKANAEYGTAEKIKDGISLQVKKITVVLQTKGYDAKRCPPLLLITLNNFNLHQTDGNWKKIQNLEVARHFNENDEQGELSVYRQLHVGLTVHLVPYTADAEDPAHSLLKGAYIDQFAAKTLANGKRGGGGALGSTVLLSKIALNGKLIEHKHEQQRSSLGTHIAVHVGKVQLSLDDLQMAMLLDFTAALALLRHREKEYKAKFSNGSVLAGAPHQPNPSHNKKKKKKEAKEDKRVKSSALEVHVASLVLEIAHSGLRKWESSPFKVIRVELLQLYLGTSTLAERGDNNVVHQTKQIQGSVAWLEGSFTAPNGVRTLILYADTSATMTPLELEPLSLDRAAVAATDAAKKRKENDKQLFCGFFSAVTPAPPPPDHAHQLQLRAYALKLHVYEVLVEGILIYFTNLKAQCKVAFQTRLVEKTKEDKKWEKLATKAAKKEAKKQAVVSTQAEVLPDTGTPAPKSASSYGLACVAELQLPTFYLYPRGMEEPLLVLEGGSLIVAANAGVSEPMLVVEVDSSRVPLCGAFSARVAPHTEGDFLCQHIHRSSFTHDTLQLEATLQGLGIFFLDTADSRRAEPLLSLTLPAKAYLMWDDKTTPQMQASVSIPHVALTLKDTHVDLATEVVRGSAAARAMASKHLKDLLKYLRAMLPKSAQDPDQDPTFEEAPVKKIKPVKLKRKELLATRLMRMPSLVGALCVARVDIALRKEDRILLSVAVSQIGAAAEHQLEEPDKRLPATAVVAHVVSIKAWLQEVECFWQTREEAAPVALLSRIADRVPGAVIRGKKPEKEERGPLLALRSQYRFGPRAVEGLVPVTGASGTAPTLESIQRAILDQKGHMWEFGPQLVTLAREGQAYNHGSVRLWVADFGLLGDADMVVDIIAMLLVPYVPDAAEPPGLEKRQRAGGHSVYSIKDYNKYIEARLKAGLGLPPEDKAAEEEEEEETEEEPTPQSRLHPKEYGNHAALLMDRVSLAMGSLLRALSVSTTVVAVAQEEEEEEEEGANGVELRFKRASDAVMRPRTSSSNATPHAGVEEQVSLDWLRRQCSECRAEQGQALPAHSPLWRDVAHALEPTAGGKDKDVLYHVATLLSLPTTLLNHEASLLVLSYAEAIVKRRAVLLDLFADVVAQEQVGLKASKNVGQRNSISVMMRSVKNLAQVGGKDKKGKEAGDGEEADGELDGDREVDKEKAKKLFQHYKSIDRIRKQDDLREVKGAADKSERHKKKHKKKHLKDVEVEITAAYKGVAAEQERLEEWTRLFAQLAASATQLSDRSAELERSLDAERKESARLRKYIADMEAERERFFSQVTKNTVPKNTASAKEKKSKK